ncbi:MAG: MFS transporter [Thiotrichales bacterium]|jgi:PPP family 3-phenylpropionic acid transporter|nr:MFS transporter [Thiotrichales bacterium]
MSRKSIEESQDLPFVSLSAYYFFYFAAVGVVIPFLGLYFQSLHFSAIEVAQLLAVLSFARIVSPPIWALLADRRGQFLFYVQLASLLTALLSLGLLWLDQYWSLFWLVTLLGFFWHAALPPMESLTLLHLGEALDGYSRIRLWGSVGFIVAVLGAGWLIDAWGQVAFLVITIGFFWIMTIFSLMIKPSSAAKENAFDLAQLKQLLRNRAVLLVLLIALMMQIAHGIYYAFYSILLAEIGYSGLVIGLLWSLGVVAEIVLFWMFFRVISRFSFQSWIVFATSVSVIRWGLIAWFPDSLWWLLIAQLMHAATFAVFHSVVVQWLHVVFLGHQAQGQALYSSLSYGVGGVVGSLLAGYAWAQGGGVAAFGVASFVSLCALLLSFLLTKRNLLQETVN